MSRMPRAVHTGMTMQKKQLLPARRWRLAAIGVACLMALAACKKSDEAAPASVAFSRPDSSMMPATVIQQASGGAFIAGAIFNEMGPSTWGWVARVDVDGRTLWDKDLGKKAQSASFDAGVEIWGGNVLLVGTVNAGNASRDPASAWLLALTGDGRTLWDRAFNLGSRTHALAITAVPRTKDDYLVMGSVRDGERDAEHTDRAWVVRIDGAGHESLRKVLDSPDTLAPEAMAVLADGSFVVAGRVFVGPERSMQGWIGRFAADGTPQWSRTLDAKDSRIPAVKVEASKRIVMVVNDGRDAPMRLMRLDVAGKTLQDGGRVALCDKPALWQTRQGPTQLGGLPCPAAGKPADGIVIVPDLDHPDRVQRLGGVPGVEIEHVASPDGGAHIDLLGTRRDGDFGVAVLATRPIPRP